MCLSSASGRRTEMARRTFTMVDVTEILEHWYAGRPKVEVARSLGVDAKTVRRYVAPAHLGVLDGAAVLAAPVHPPRRQHDPAGLDRGARGRAGVPRRGAAADRAGQSQGRGVQAGPV